MNQISLTQDELYSYYQKSCKSKTMFTPYSFDLLLQSGVKRLVAKNTSGIRCLVLYLQVGEETHIICECGDVNKLGKKQPKGNVIRSSWTDNLQRESFVRVFHLERHKDLPETRVRLNKTGIFSISIIDESFKGFFSLEVRIASSPLAMLHFYKCLFKGKSSVVLAYAQLLEKIDISELVGVILLEGERLGAEMVLICDDVLEGTMYFSDDCERLTRSKDSHFFFV